MKNKGLAKYIEVSNFKVSNLEEILPGAKIIPLVNQIYRDYSTSKNCSIILYYIKLHLHV